MVAPLPISEPIAPLPPVHPERNVLLWNLLALVVALLAAGGSLFVSIGLGLRACPLCFYQRSFMLGVAAILLMGLLTEARTSALVSLLAMPLAAAGLGVAGYHVYLEATGKMECPGGLFSLGSVPQQSLAAHGVLLLLLVIAGLRRPAMVVGLVLGLLAAYGCVASTHPLKLHPEDFQGAPTICRPVRS